MSESTPAANRPSFFRRLFGNVAFLCNLGAALWLGLCFAAGYVSPERIAWLQLFTLTTPFALAANIGFLFFWLFFARRKWRLVLPVFMLALCYKLLLATFGWHFFAQQDMQPGANRMKVMTWNVHGLGIFNKPVSNDTDRRILDVIRTERPDILCMQEFYTVRNNALQPYATAILEENGYEEYRFRFDNTLGTTIYLGTAVFSRYPIRQYRYIKLGYYVYMLECDVALPNNKMMRAYIGHLQSFRLPDKDKALIEDVKHRKEDIGAGKSKNILKRFLAAYRLRAHQADTVASIMAESPYPLLVCGDMNDLPGSYTYYRMRGRNNDVFEEKGQGFGRTYNMFSPTLRIDHMFYNPGLLRVVGIKQLHTNLSDHNPVIANFELR